MRVSILRSLLCWAMVAIVPVTLLGQTPSAVLHTQGGVWVNGFEARDSSAIFSGDLLETKPGFSATLNLDGSSVLIQAESVAKFQGDLLVLDHGSVAVGTSKKFKVRVNCLTVVPVVDEWTQYEVTDVNRTVEVAAHKLDVNVEREMSKQKPAEQGQPPQEGSVHEGEQKNYDESAVCGAPLAPKESGAGLNPKWIAAGGAAAAGIIICAILCLGGGKHPVSPDAP